MLVIMIKIGLWSAQSMLVDPIDVEVPMAVSYEEVTEVLEVEEVIEPVEDLEAIELVEEEEIGEEGNDSVLPESINLAVPFTPQAPHANWDMPYQEACEEASLSIAHAYYEGVTAGVISAEVADEELIQMIDFEEETLGFDPDISAQETVELIKAYYGYDRVDILTNPTIEELQEQLAAGRPVIVPAAGQLLENPYFTAPGPLYHMLVLRGYTSDYFITNDQGTRRGDGYLYPFETIMQAMHDWNDGDVKNGEKVVIVIHPNE